MTTGNYDLIHLVAALLASLVASWIALAVLRWIPGVPALRRFINGNKLRIWLAHGLSLVATTLWLTSDMPAEEAVFLNAIAEAIWLWGDFRRLRRTADDPAERRIDLSRGFIPGTGIPVFVLIVVVFGYGVGGEALRWNFAALRWPDAPAPWERIDGFVLAEEPIAATDLADLAACEAWIAENRTAPDTASFCAAGPDRYDRWPALSGLPNAYRLVVPVPVTSG